MRGPGVGPLRGRVLKSPLIEVNSLPVMVFCECACGCGCACGIW